MLAVLIVAGLIATPANCACGAGMPHVHSAFMLPGHHHASDGHYMKLSGPSHGHSQRHGASASDDDSPRMQEMTGHANDPLMMLIGEAQPGDDAWQRWTPTYAQSVLPEGQVLRPETGPPQYPA